MASLSQPLRELQGPLLPPKDLVEEEDDYLRENAEEEEDTVFVDAEELCSGGVKAGSLPGRLRDMSAPNQLHICSLFLKDCNVSSENRMKFLAWVNEESSYEDLNFENLREKLRTYQENMGRNTQKQSTQKTQEESPPDSEILLPLENTIPFITVMRALQFPKIMEFLPVLLPRHFKRLMSSDSTEVLEEIEEILGTQPWKLGFRKITYRQLKLLRCEASWTSFCQCRSLLQLMSDLERNALVIYSELKQICREQGHTCVEEADLTYELSDRMSFHDAWQSLKFLKDIGVVTYEKGCVFLYDLYQAERGIASSICDLMTRSPWRLHVDVKKVLASIHTTRPENSGSDDMLNKSKPDETRLEDPVDIWDTQDSGDHIWDNGENEVKAEISEVQLDQDQVAALDLICSNAVTVISGKGGSGKTTIVSQLFKHIELLEEREVKKACEDFEQDQNEPEEWITFTKQSQLKPDKAIEVLLTAPTGKAAGLLRQKTGFSAYTLCQVNYSFYLWEKKKMTKDMPWKFSSVRVLVVDEGSLVSVGIFKSVLNLLCEHSQLSKLIILGDIRQLPSIEPGNLLKDLFETLKSRNCAIELKTNHRAESELIVDNATRISRRQFPTFDAELNISDDPTFHVSIQDKSFIFVRLPEEDANSQFSKSNHHSYLYSAVSTLLKEKDLEDAKTSQFIAFRRQDCDVINTCCCKHYTGRLIKNHQNRLEFGVGDKICCTRNAYLSDLLPENTFNSQQNNELKAGNEDFNGTSHGFAKNKHDFESGIRLCNGEVFFITEDKTDITFGKKRFLTINNMAGFEVTVDFGKLMQYCHIKHAWARTIHTFQGSEEKTVVYVVGKAGRQHWQHVYTAVTRGRCRVYVIAEESQLRSAIMKNSVPRKTRLKHFLQNKLSESSASPADFASPSKSPEDSRRPSTHPSASPLPTATDDRVTDYVPRRRASVAGDTLFAFAEGWKLSSSDEVHTIEDPSQSRGSKRTCCMNAAASPNKILMVEESSPQVSSKLQNLRLNSLTPRQLFKPTNNQET
ncbi:DNA helicase B isoform X2 [Kogia breviceps]|uniref:DNA helicase B isoform X2 n=1 Tax=Kogia breviceps TaxID=27615 RepID=UPI0034D23419